MAAMANEPKEYPDESIPYKGEGAALFGAEMKLLGPAHADYDDLPRHEICQGVEYHTVAREWRFRFTGRDARIRRPRRSRSDARPFLS